ncbi:hypothetical protein [Methylobacterium sp. E-046]|uniref:hypothetical protein n=1 Tax=Methylobacterium sp. E-046 TaxID=2836576 RepID=UPI001FBB788D|nr:hypothetical protein [Methylobacterium sp. E-046]MCJ2102477.1 hypothetical protein [Methylobacterium sp. E-046]
MFDFSWTSILVGFASLLFAAISPVTLKILAAAFAVLVIGRIVLPARLRIVTLTAAAGVAAFAFCWQAAVADGARRMLVHDHAVALQAEQLRAEKAEAITHEALELRARDQVARTADLSKIKELTDALARDPRRDGVCLPRLWSQRLRKL